VKIGFTSLVFREKNMYVAYCPELDVSSCGREVDEARKNLFEAVSIFLEETRQLGTLNEILEEAGYVPLDKKHGEWTPPNLILTERRELTFPSGG
jgi:predicted RNase H-like HicB family nuclease